MEQLDQETEQFFKSGGQQTPSEAEAEATTTTEKSAETTTAAPPKQAEVSEKKVPSKFTYSPDTDNVQDETGRKYVPLGAVQEARNENKTLKKELEELKQKWTGGEQKLNALLQKIEKPKDSPKYEENPLEHLKAKNQELEERIKSLAEAEESRGKERETNTQLAEFQRNVVAAEKSFAKANPDYAEAVAKVQEVWRHEYELAGVPEQLIDSMLARKGAQFSYASLQKEQNPAEAVYKLAQRYGYNKKTEQKDEPNKDKDKLAQIAKGQEAEKSLTSGKGSSDMSLEALASMSEEELEEFASKHWSKLQKAAKAA